VVFDVNAPVVTEVPVPTSVPPQLPVYQCKVVPDVGFVAVRVDVPPAQTGDVAATLVGSAGLTFTVSVHRLLVALVLGLLLTTHERIVVAETLFSVQLGWVAPEILLGFVAPVRHWYESGGVPAAVTEKIACDPEHTVCEIGCTVMDGALMYRR